MSTYLRFAALGDSATVGVGDPVPDGWRGWARLLADAMAGTHDVSFQNLATTGATTTSVREEQLQAALDHRPDVASLVVGINDTMRSGWSPDRVRTDLHDCAGALHAGGATLLTARFHDHGAVLGLPGPLRRALWRRIEQVNQVYDEVHARFGGIQIDLQDSPLVGDRRFWSTDRLHPSELGHRQLARAYAVRLHRGGIPMPLPGSARAGGVPPSLSRDCHWMVSHGLPWIGRRAHDLAPWLVRNLVAEAARTGAEVVGRRSR